jgi:ABC-type branched-subunit amino acid transport system substrate-binding protein
MRCPRCNFDGELVQGGCARCGYGRASTDSQNTGNQTSSRYNQQYVLPSTLATMQILMRGDMLRRGRYRLVEQVLLPENQRRQGVAWLASDTQNSSRRVLIREVAFPTDVMTDVDKEQTARSISLKMTELAQHPGFPRVIDVFNDRGSYYIVFQHPEGETLGTLLARQGGALPQHTVAAYGQQLCEMLAHLEHMRPPIVHGSINPDTIIISPDRKRVSLIYLPLFTPSAQLPSKSNAPSGYMAPEQVRGQIDPSIDLYSLAATLHHAVTGYDPHERMAFFHPPARRLNPAVTPEMEAILTQALRLSGQQRYPRANDMLKDISSVLVLYPPVLTQAGNPAKNPLLLNSAEIRQRSRSRSRTNVIVFAAVSGLIILGFFLAYFRSSLPSFGGSTNNTQLTATSIAQNQAALNNEIALEMSMFQKKGIGLSDGRIVLDSYGRPSHELALKKQAAQAIQHNDVSTAVNLLSKAITEDPTDGEAQIYNEDIHILQSGAPYVTIVMGVALDNNAADYLLAHAELQAAYLAQHEINTNNTLPHAKLRLLIDSSGANNDDVAAVAQLIANRVLNAGNIDHIIGVVGWPFSSQTINARDIIAGAHIPLLSETASSVKLSGSSQYFFRVNPPDDLQGKTLGTVAVDPNEFNAKKILVLRDPTDTYSQSLADAFTARVQALHATAINNPADNFTEGTTTVVGYQKVINDALRNNADLIFLAGIDTDAVRLAHALAIAIDTYPGNLTLARLKILGGDAIDTGLILGQGDGPDAAIARNFPQDIQRLSFTAFGHPDEWSFLKLHSQPAFFHNWVSTYQSSTVPSNNAPPAGNDAILTYDAVGVMVAAAKLVQGDITGQAVRDALASLGKNNVPPYHGISGRILFDVQGNPIDKALVVLTVRGNSNGTGNTVELLKVAGSFN